MVLVLIVFTMSFYLVININSLHMFKKFIHHNFGLDNPYYNFYSIFLFKIKEKILYANFHCIHGSFMCKKIIQWKLLHVDQKKLVVKLILNVSNFWTQEVF
jgi:hypothetical protein